MGLNALVIGVKREGSRAMTIEELEEFVFQRPIMASDGNHSARLWRVAENVQDNVDCSLPDERLLHLISRVGVFSRSLARDLRSGFASPEQVAILLDQLADLGEIGFEEWLKRSAVRTK